MPGCSAPDPAVSVVIPARNEERFVGAALASVRAQTWPLAELEAVVVDNGSVDGTRGAVERFQAAEPRLAVRLIRHEPAGVAGAKNRGATEARGRILIFLDADSRMAANLAERVIAHATRGYPAGSIRVVADSADQLDRAYFELIEFGKVRFRIRAQMFYCERETFWRLGGFDERLRVAEDRDFLMRLQRAGVRVCHVRDSAIATSTRRLHALPARLGMLTMLVRWALANQGIGRRWRY